MASLNELKHRLRKLKVLEKIIRFNGKTIAGKTLIWDSFFDLNDTGDKKAKYTLLELSSMSKEEYKKVIDEYFAFVYYELYKENYMIKTYDSEALSQLNLPFDAGEMDIKKRFRELAKEYHPDTGGDKEKFIELMKIYEKLIGK